MDRADSAKLIAQLCEEPEQHMVRLNIAVVCCSRMENLPRSLEANNVNTVNATVQQLGYGTVKRLRQGLNKVYSAAHQPL